MKEYPISFCCEMVRKILSDEKTMTRRVMIPQPINVPEGAYCDPYNHNYDSFTFWTKDNKMLLNCGGDRKNKAHWKSHYGQPGYRLWVRETWAPIHYPEGDLIGYEYKADTDNKYPGGWPDDYGDDPECGRWKASRYMPRIASRIDLEVTKIRVERVQDITEEDAKKEGMVQSCTKSWGKQVYRFPFYCLWDGLYEKSGYGWDVNPWVWVVEFKRIPKVKNA